MLGGRVVGTYGLTETCGGVVYDGRCLPGTRVRIAPSDDRIELRGPTLMEGYRFDPGATGAAFTPDGWLRTGDAGSLDDEGRLHSARPIRRRDQDRGRDGVARRRSSVCSPSTPRWSTSR